MQGPHHFAENSITTSLFPAAFKNAFNSSWDENINEEMCTVTESHIVIQGIKWQYSCGAPPHCSPGDLIFPKCPWGHIYIYLPKYTQMMINQHKSFQFSSVTQSCPTLCHPTKTLGFYLPDGLVMMVDNGRILLATDWWMDVQGGHLHLIFLNKDLNMH